MSSADQFTLDSYNPRDPWSFPPERLVAFCKAVVDLWKVQYQKWLPLKPWPDERFAVFQELHGQSFSGYMYALMLREHGSKEEWWNALPDFEKPFARNTVRANNMGLRNYLHFSGLSYFCDRLELCLFNVLDAVEPQLSRILRRELPQTGLEVLMHLGLPEYVPLIELLDLWRTVQTTNGKFFSREEEDRTIEYKNMPYLFEHGKEIETDLFGFLDGWDYLEFLYRESAEMLNAIFETYEVKMVHALVSPHLR